MTEIGEKIREIRTKKGLSQEDLAESAKVNLRTIQRLENNETKPRGNTLNLICNALDIDMGNIIELDKQLNRNYVLLSIILTSIVLISTFLGWFTFEATRGGLVEKFGIMRMTTTGWNGNITVLRVPINHWLVSLSSLSIGVIVISNALGIINKHLKFILGQLIFFSLYIIVITLNVLISKTSDFELGFFLITLATIVLTVLYFRVGTIKK